MCVSHASIQVSRVLVWSALRIDLAELPQHNAGSSFSFLDTYAIVLYDSFMSGGDGRGVWGVCGWVVEGGRSGNCRVGFNTYLST